MKNIKIPTKRTLNLVVKEKTLASPTRLIPILFMIMLGAYAFVQFAVINRLNQVKQAEAELLQMKNQLEIIQNSYSDFKDVEREYNRYTYQNFDSTIPDRLEVLAMIERRLFTIGTVKNISISGRTVSLTLEGPNLQEVSWLYTTLYSEPLIEDVTISAFNGENRSDGNTTITMTINLVNAAELSQNEESEGENGGLE